MPPKGKKKPWETGPEDEAAAQDTQPGSEPAAETPATTDQTVIDEVVAESTESTEEGGKPEVVLDAPYAYYDDDDVLHSWQADQKVTDQTVIDELIKRGAPLKG